VRPLIKDRHHFSIFSFVALKGQSHKILRTFFWFYPIVCIFYPYHIIFILKSMFVFLQNFFNYSVPSGMFFAWQQIFAMLPVPVHLFYPFNGIHLCNLPPSTYSSYGKYNSPMHFYNPKHLCCRVVIEPGLCTSTRSS
jgi:hypothetical protein